MSSLATHFNRAWTQRGPLAWAMRPLSMVMGAVVAWRRAAYHRGQLASVRLPVPVIVVGNRVVGGAGKTPTTIALLAHLQAQGWRPGVLSRGYKAALPQDGHVLLDADSHTALSARQTGDEPMLIWRRTGVPLMVGRDRVAGGQKLLRAHPEINLLVCDDGLQHLRLQRDLEIVVFDGRGAGNGWLLPAGPLREPIDAAPPPGLKAPPLVLYNAPQASTALPGHTARTGTAPIRRWADWQAGRQDGPTLSPEATQAHALWAVAGIAHPDRFFDSLRRLGYAPRTQALDDHAELQTLPWPPDARDVIVTEKDAVKLDADLLARERPATRVWVAALDFQPEPSFWRELDTALGRPPNRTSPG